MNEERKVYLCRYPYDETVSAKECGNQTDGNCGNDGQPCDCEEYLLVKPIALAALRAKNAELETRVKELEAGRMKFIKACERIIATGKNLLIRDHAYFNTWWHREFEDAINDFLTPQPPSEFEKG